jgi:hypothetical protein
VLAKVSIVAIFPHVAATGIEERVVTPAIRELDMVEDSVRHDGLGLKDWSQSDHRKKQSDEREDRLRVKVSAHASISFRDFRPHFTISSTPNLRPSWIPSVAEPVDRTAIIVTFHSPW